MAECLQYLTERSLPMEVIHHPPVFTMEQLHALQMPREEQIAKNLFLRDDKKRNFYLISVRGDTPVDLRALQSRIATRRLSFSSASDLQQLLGVRPGAVTPLGLLNDLTHCVQYYLDDRFLGKCIGVHPLENTATVFLNAEDLLQLLREAGCPADWLTLQSESK
jgi:Ala-tRNA(Pro) deacylase